jgi:hypothetical protein
MDSCRFPAISAILRLLYPIQINLATMNLLESLYAYTLFNTYIPGKRYNFLPVSLLASKLNLTFSANTPLWHRGLVDSNPAFGKASALKHIFISPAVPYLNKQIKFEHLVHLTSQSSSIGNKLQYLFAVPIRSLVLVQLLMPEETTFYYFSLS